MASEITAYKCDITGALFEDKERAVRSEFRAMMKRVGGSCPAMGSVNPVSIMEWLESNITSNVYPTVFPRLLEALEYWRDNGPSQHPSTQSLRQEG